MNKRSRQIVDLVRDDLYVVEEAAVAEAILLRSYMRRMLPGIIFPQEVRRAVRSFRRTEDTHSFRLAAERRRTRSA